MKYLILLFSVFSSLSLGLENSDEKIINKILSQANLSVPFYNTDFLGERQFELFKTSERHGWFIHQSNYGGDGSNTGNILMIFDVFFEKEYKNFTTEFALNKIYQYPISNVTFDSSNSNRIIIKGDYITSLCDVCDSWEATTEDVFIIPIEIEIPSFIIATKLNQAEKQQTYDRLIERVIYNNKVQSSYGIRNYPIFSEGILEEVTSILQITK